MRSGPSESRRTDGSVDPSNPVGQMRDGLEAHHDLAELRAESLSGPQRERHARPARCLELEGDLGERLGAARRIDALLGAVVGEVAVADRTGRVSRSSRVGDGIIAEHLRRPQCGGFRVTEVDRVERRWRIHRDDRQHLQQVTLDHVDEGAGMVVVAGASFQPEALVVPDRDRLDVLVRPHRFEDAVREAQAEHVEHRRAPHEVVDAVDLLLRHEPPELGVQRSGARLIRPERLLEREDEPFGQFHLLEGLARACGDRGGDGEVHRDPSFALPEQGAEFLGIGDVGAAVLRSLADGVCARPGRLGRGKRRADGLAPPGVVPVVDPGTDEPDMSLGLLGQQLPECGKKQPGGEVARGTQDAQRRVARHVATIAPSLGPRPVAETTTGGRDRGCHPPSRPPVVVSLPEAARRRPQRARASRSFTRAPMRSSEFS